MNTLNYNLDEIEALLLATERQELTPSVARAKLAQLDFLSYGAHTRIINKAIEELKEVK